MRSWRNRALIVLLQWAVATAPGGSQERSSPEPDVSGRAATQGCASCAEDSTSDAGMVRIGSFAIDRFEFPNRRRVLPRVNVSWEEARRLCESQGKRLCTESEWQWAAGGPRHLRYGYGDTYQDGRCNTPRQTESGWIRDGGLAVSGAFPGCSSEYGVYDMVGNVWEWAMARAEGDSLRPVVRGGSWFHSANMARVDARFSHFPSADYRLDLIGFRCCRTVRGDEGRGGR